MALVLAMRGAAVECQVAPEPAPPTRFQQQEILQSFVREQGFACGGGREGIMRGAGFQVKVGICFRWVCKSFIRRNASYILNASC